MPNFRIIKIYSRNYAAGIRKNYHESSDCFEYPNKSLLRVRFFAGIEDHIKNPDH